MAKKNPVKETPITLQSENTQLVGMLHSANSGKLIIMCHGFTGNKTENKRLFVEAAREFAVQGFDAFRFDFYGSGDSEGEFKETKISHNIANLRDVVKWAQARGYSELAVLGISMGAATAILCIRDLPIRALVTWSAVPDMKQIFEMVVDDVDHLQEEAAVREYNGWLINREFGEDALQYDVQKAFAELTIPKLIIQGSADAEPFVRGFHTFRDIAQPPADFMEIPEAGHTYQTPYHRKQVIRQTAIWFKRNF